MLFKQSILKEEIIKFLILLFAVLILPVALIIIALVNHERLNLLMIFLLIFYVPIFLLISIMGLINLEWFNIYEDRIESRCLFGIKNVVYYDNIIFIEKVKINLTSRGMEKLFYIFNDGRKNNNNYFDNNSCYNKKKFNFRIYKSVKIDEFIYTKLKEKLK